MKIFFILDNAIIDFMAYYRGEFPDESVSPKMHMLEDHVLTFIKKWRIGLGMYAEQGGESIHAEFNNLKDQHRGIREADKRLKFMLEKHHMKVRPIARSMTPAPKQRNFSKKRV